MPATRVPRLGPTVAREGGRQSGRVSPPRLQLRLPHSVRHLRSGRSPAERPVPQCQRDTCVGLGLWWWGSGLDWSGKGQDFHKGWTLSPPPPCPKCGPEAPDVTPTRVPKECGCGNFTRRSRTGSVVVCVAPSPARGSLWHKPLTHRVGLATCLAGVGHTPIPPPPVLTRARFWFRGQKCADRGSPYLDKPVLPRGTYHGAHVADVGHPHPSTHDNTKRNQST